MGRTRTVQPGQCSERGVGEDGKGCPLPFVPPPPFPAGRNEDLDRYLDTYACYVRNRLGQSHVPGGDTHHCHHVTWVFADLLRLLLLLSSLALGYDECQVIQTRKW